MDFVVFTMIPIWGSICLGRVNLAYTRTTVTIPKFWGGQLQNIIDTCSALRVSANAAFHSILQHDSITLAPLLYLCRFDSGHFNPFKSFFVLWIWTVTNTGPDVDT
jgi:hypothetical protein